MISIPVVFFMIGTHCLFDAYSIFKTNQKQNELASLIHQMGIFHDRRSYQEKKTIAQELNEILEKENSQPELVEFMKKY